MGELINLNPVGTIADADIPTSIARDAELLAAIAAHQATDHSQSGLIVTSGVWTPSLTYSTPGTMTVTYARATGRYQKIGNIVLAVFDIRLSNFTKGTAGGFPLIQGLPFATRAPASAFDSNYGILIVFGSAFTGIPYVDTATASSLDVNRSSLALVTQLSSNANPVPLASPTSSSSYRGQIQYECS